MLLRLSICLLVLALAGCSRPSPMLQVTDFGIYTADVPITGDWSKGIPVEVQSVDNAVLKEETTRIPAQIGVNWGVSLLVTNNYLFKAVEVVGIMQHPAFTTPDGKTSTEDVLPYGTVNPGKAEEMPYYWCFLKEEPYELVPGKWTLRIQVDGRTMMTKEFEVYKP